MAARRALSLLAFVVALGVAGLFAIWAWAAAATGRDTGFVIGLVAAALLCTAFAVRSLLANFGGRLRVLQPFGSADVLDPRLHMLGDARDDRAPDRPREPGGCPWCNAPRISDAERCAACGQAF